jgi:hypothetical protein
MDCLALVMEVSPQHPMIFLSCIILDLSAVVIGDMHMTYADTSLFSDNSSTVVSASTMKRYS